MLKKPDVNVDLIMKHADFIAGLDADRFSQRKWGFLDEPRCICGWLLHNAGIKEKDNVEIASKMLGIEYMEACKLFAPEPQLTPKEAAARLRHLAITGEVADV